MLKEKSDSELLHLFSENQDQVYIGELFFRHSDIAYRTALSRLKNTSDAEDIVQIAFIEVFKTYKNFHDGSFVAWLLKIVTNRSIDRIRSNARRRKREAKVETNLYHEDKMKDHHQDKIIMDHLEKLPDHYKQPIYLKILENLSVKEISEILCLPEKTIRTQITRGLEKLRSALSVAGVKVTIIVLTSSLAKIKLSAAPISLKSQNTVSTIFNSISRHSSKLMAASPKPSFFSTNLFKALLTFTVTTTLAGIYFLNQKLATETIKQQTALNEVHFDFEDESYLSTFQVQFGSVKRDLYKHNNGTTSLSCEDFTFLEVDVSQFKLPFIISYEYDAELTRSKFSPPLPLFKTLSEEEKIYYYFQFKKSMSYSSHKNSIVKMSDLFNNKWKKSVSIFTKDKIINIEGGDLSSVIYTSPSNKVLFTFTNAVHLDNFTIQEATEDSLEYDKQDIQSLDKSHQIVKNNSVVNKHYQLDAPFPNKANNKKISLLVYSLKTIYEKVTTQDIPHMKK